MPSRNFLRVRRMKTSDSVEILPTLTFKQAARMILAARPGDSIEMIELDLRASQHQVADGVIYFADIVRR